MIRNKALVPLFIVLSFTQGLLVATPALAQEASSVFVDVSGGLRHICALDAQGALSCRQSSDASRLVPPSNLPVLTDVEAGSVHACGLTQDGTAVCWGDNDFGQLDVPESANFASIKAGWSHSCGITPGGAVECWGLNDLNQITPPADLLLDEESGEPVTLVALELTEKVSCGLDTQGFLYCWGDRDLNHRSDASLANAETGATVVKFAIDRQYPLYKQCGLLSDGSIDCVNNEYQFNEQYSDIAGARRMICGLTLDGDLDCRNILAYTEAESIQARIDDINAGEPLVSINGSVDLCGITASGGIKCLDTYNSYFTIPVPGEALPAFAAPENLQVAVYGDTTVELLWDYYNNPWEIAQVEIYRDGELLAQVNQLTSYLDQSLEPGRDYTYQVRYLAVSGAIGEFSETIFVNTTGPDYTPPARPFEIQNLQALVYGPDLLELLWDRPSGSNLGYEIRRNGEYLAFTTGASYLDRLVEPGNDPVYEVITVDSSGTMLGVAMTVAEVN